MKKLRNISILFLLVVLAGGVYLYQSIWGENVTLDKEVVDIKLPTGSNFEDLVESLSANAIIDDKSSFLLTSKLMKFDQQKVKSGLFEIKNGMSNRSLIQHLRSGNQKELDLTFNNERTIADLVGNISGQMELDSQPLLEYLLKPSNLEAWDINEEELLCQFLPNTYKVYWNWSAEKLVKKLMSERDKFWAKNNRTKKAEALGLSINEVCTLAAIVEKETLVEDEKSTIAGVYINRLKRDMALQADPTVVYAVGDFTIRRVLNKHLAVDNPYNTYMYPGLPPGPIYLPNTTTIDAVLNFESHNYLYFCAKPDNSGRHAFAKNLVGHNRNASVYQRWLSAQGIRG